MRLRNLYTILSNKDNRLNILIEGRRFDFSILNKKFPNTVELFIQLKHNVMAFGSHNAKEVYILDLGEGNRIVNDWHSSNGKYILPLFPRCRRSATNISFTIKELDRLYGCSLKVFVAINAGDRARADYVVNGIMGDHEEYNEDLYLDLLKETEHKILLELDTIFADKKYFNRTDQLDGKGRIGIYSIMNHFPAVSNETVKLAIGLLSVNLDALP